ncbi:peptidoglycan-binding domain-containing protein [Lentzea sp. NPDC055074]
MKRLLKAVAVVTSVVAVTLTVGLPAQASVSQGYISGGGTVTDDWGDEGELSRSTFPNSSATGIWQKVLYADGYLTVNDIDCRFGQNTESATRRWQAARSLGDDGRVGTLTFGRADNQLRATGDPEIFRYDGTSRDEYFLRVNGRYELFPGHVAYYRSISSAC